VPAFDQVFEAPSGMGARLNGRTGTSARRGSVCSLSNESDRTVERMTAFPSAAMLLQAVQHPRCFAFSALKSPGLIRLDYEVGGLAARFPGGTRRNRLSLSSAEVRSAVERRLTASGSRAIDRTTSSGKSSFAERAVPLGPYHRQDQENFVIGFRPR